ncbi:MAG: RHS repeat protein, partial [Alphaproteobacteria bacterium]|nr:RHS repeat protein [Alphaproteobacteria bacterium]
MSTLSTTLPSGGTYHYAYDDRGNQTEVSDDAGNVIFERVYNPDGSIATLTDRFGTVTYDYGAQGMPVRVMGADGTITELDYDILGNVTEVRRGGVTQRFRYDAGGRRLHSDFGNGVTVAYEYDNGDDWTAIQGPTFGRVERRVSSSGRLLSWTEPNGDTFSQTFDASGQLRSRIDELGNVTTYTYDAAGRLESTLDAARGATTSYVRDPLGRVLSQTDPAGEVRSYTYDPRGSVATTTDERMHVTTSTTLPTSTSTTDALSNTTTNTQTDYGLPSSSTYPGGASTASAFNGLTHIDSSTSFPASQTDESSRVPSITDGPTTRRNAGSNPAPTPWSYS